MKNDEKVMAEWPTRLRDDAQKLEEVPAGMDTDYIMIRVQSKETSAVVRAISKLATESSEAAITLVVVKQAKNRWQPRNSWPTTRGAFDWVLGHVRQTLAEDKQKIDRKQSHRDIRRQERAS